MAGEYPVARATLEQAFAAAEQEPAMSGPEMADALLVTLLKRMLKERPRKDLARFIEYQLESLGEDEFVITRGC